jgi:hypothetical protein
MPLPVVTIPAGGLPVAEAANNLGTPVIEASNGFGIAVTKVAAGKPGLPVVYFGGLLYPPADLVAWPDATNTGVPAGTTLTPVTGDVSTTADSQVIDRLAITGGTILVNHNNVLIQRCKVDTTGSRGVLIAPGKSGIMVRDCEFLNSQDAVFGSGFTMLRCNVHGTENGAEFSGGHNIVVRDNYIHDFFSTPDPHYDGFQSNGSVSNITIEHNRVANQFNQTSGVFLDDEFGAADNLKVINNWFSGAGYGIHCAGAGLTNVVIQNNLFGLGAFGFYDFTTPPGQMTVSGNVSTQGLYIDGDVPPLVGTLAFTPSAAITSGSDQNINTGFRVAATLAQPIATEFRLILYSGTINSMGIEAVAFGKASSGQVATAALSPVLFGGVSPPLPTAPTLRYVASDWMPRGALSFPAGSVMLIGFSLRNPGGTGASTGNTNAASYFGPPANMTLANPAYTAIAGACYALARIETR